MIAASAADAAPKAGRLEDYFDLVSRTFDAAASRTGSISRYLKVGGHHLELRFAGESLLGSLFPAFSHLEVAEPRKKHMVIGLWDMKSTGVEVPRPTWPGGTNTRGLISGYTQGSIKTAWEQVSRGLSILNSARSEGFFCVPDSARLPPHESSFPLRTLLSWWLGGQGLQLVHAGAVGTDRGAALLAGMGGSGKSNTTLACLDAGLLYAGDDFVAVNAEHATVFSLYSTAKLFQHDLDKFPRLRHAVDHPGGDGDDKAVLLLHPHFKGQLVEHLPLRAILLPKVTGGVRTRLRKASPAESLLRMAPSTLVHLPGADRSELRAMARIAAQIPSYFLDLGSDCEEITSTIRSALDLPE